MYKIKNSEFFVEEFGVILLRRVLISSFLSAFIATIISFLSVKLNYFPNSPIVLFIPFIASIIGITVYFRLIYRNEFNMAGKESIIFGLLSAIFWTLFTAILGTTIFTGVYNYSWSPSSIAPSLIFGFAIFICGAFFCSGILPPIGLSLGKETPSPLSPSSAHRRKILSIIVFVVVVFLPIVMFPTPHVRSVSSLMQSIPGIAQTFPFEFQYMGQKFPLYLFGGQSSPRDVSTTRPRRTLGPMVFRTVIDVQSTEDLSLFIAIEESYSAGLGKPTVLQTHVGYNETAKIHKSSFQQAVTGDDAMIRYLVTATNPAPSPFPNGVLPSINWDVFLKNGTIIFYYSGNVTMPTPLIANGTINVYQEYQYTEWTEWWRP